MLVDDNSIVSEGLRLMIESQSGLRFVGSAAARAEALEIATRQQPDIILLDVGPSESEVLDLTPDLLLAAREARIIILTDRQDYPTVSRAARLGVMGMVLKSESAEMLIKAIEKVHEGEVWLDRSMMARLLLEITRPAAEQPLSPEEQKIATLTSREREVIALVGQGLKNKQIAQRLTISERTVRHHLTAIFDKLTISNRRELAIYAYQHNLAQLPSISSRRHRARHKTPSLGE
jgi:DNA-binding NarL/FixJ family response regulator